MKRLFLLLPLVAALTLAGCRSKKIDEPGPIDPSALAQADPVTRVNYNRIPARGITAKLNLKVNQGQSDISVGGALKMIRNEVIQISLRPYGLVEVGRLEMTPDYLLILDRWGKQYVQTRWRDIKDLKTAGIDFYAFQALFWEELFVPGKQATALREDFEVNDLGETYRLQPGAKVASPTVNVAFVARAINGLIEQTVFSLVERNDLRFDWRYTRWTRLEMKEFPEQMLATIDAGDDHFSATFTLSHLQIDNKLRDVKTNFDEARFRKVDLDRIISRLMKM